MLHMFVQWIGEKDFLSIHYRMWRWVGKALKCRSRGRGVGGGGLGGGSTVQVCLLQYIQLQYDEGGRLEVGGEMMSIYRMKGSRRPGQPDFTSSPFLQSSPLHEYTPHDLLVWQAFALYFCNSVMKWKGPENRAVSLSSSPQRPKYFMVTFLHVICLQAVTFFGNI